MKLREFLNTCQNEWTSVNVYYDEDDMGDGYPEYTFEDMRQVDDTTLNKYVDAWYMDVNFSLHVLLSI